MDAIASKTKVTTPAVGKVRATLTSGDVFEGTLYAVGENQVWIDTQYGRMGLAASRIKTVAPLEKPKTVAALGPDGKPVLERVKIRTPGGVLFGSLVQRDGEKAIVITDDGVRLTVASKDVESLAESPKVEFKNR
jgi:hypothetical protein